MEYYKKEITMSGDILIADTFFRRLLGYMFRKEPHYGVIMLMPCRSIHTFFMRFNIDVLFINERMEVIKKVESLAPGEIIKPVDNAVAVIEAKEGVLKEIEVGCIIASICEGQQENII